LRRVSSISIGIILLFLVISISSVSFFHSVTASAQPSFCDIVVAKLAEGSGDLLRVGDDRGGGGIGAGGSVVRGEEEKGV
jgi:hypothetical protein